MNTLQSEGQFLYDDTYRRILYVSKDLGFICTVASVLPTQSGEGNEDLGKWMTQAMNEKMNRERVVDEETRANSWREWTKNPRLAHEDEILYSGVGPDWGVDLDGRRYHKIPDVDGKRYKCHKK